MNPSMCCSLLIPIFCFGFSSCLQNFVPYEWLFIQGIYGPEPDRGTSILWILAALEAAVFRGWPGSLVDLVTARCQVTWFHRNKCFPILGFKESLRPLCFAFQNHILWCFSRFISPNDWHSSHYLFCTRKMVTSKSMVLEPSFSQFLLQLEGPCNDHWIAFKEHLRRTPKSDGQIQAFRFRFPLSPLPKKPWETPFSNLPKPQKPMFPDFSVFFCSKLSVWKESIKPEDEIPVAVATSQDQWRRQRIAKDQVQVAQELRLHGEWMGNAWFDEWSYYVILSCSKDSSKSRQLLVICMMDYDGTEWSEFDNDAEWVRMVNCHPPSIKHNVNSHSHI